VVFPEALTTNEIKGATGPWQFETFYQSSRLKQISKNGDVKTIFNFDLLNEDQYYIAACTSILSVYFGMQMTVSRPFYMEIPNKVTGKVHSYRMVINADFMEVKRNENALDITQDDFHELIDNFHDIELWKRKFPPNSWKFSGFMILNMFDLTRDRIINKITKHLLQSSSEGIALLQDDLVELLGIDVSLSFVRINATQLVQGGGLLYRSMMLGKEDQMECNDGLCSYANTELIDNDRDLAIPDIKAYAKKSGSVMSKNLKKADLKSFYVAPIIFEGVKLGFLELGSKTKGALNSTTGQLLEEIMPILSVAGNRFTQEMKNRVEAVIQEECTTIHPSVKWRFEEEASKHIMALDSGQDHMFKDFVFKDVHPLFGQLDIRNSSTIRNTGIKNDLLTQLDMAKKVLKLAKKKKPLPLYDELIFILDSHSEQLETDMISSSEQDILLFLSREIRPTLEHVSTIDASLERAYKKYEKALHPELNFVYNERKGFDDSVNKINQLLANHLDNQQIKAQSMFPHHYERYKTDGVEFNMYIGDSISPGLGFHPLLVKNLRLWQLMVMCEMEQEYREARKTFDIQLDVASLILAYSNSLSIQFRMDEKKFDVEGAYNARYEIIKKRIDKAHIKGTSERITEAGKMVVVYSSEEDEKEYLRYFKFLQSKGLLKKGPPEIVTLEDLQGVSGLKALRLGVDFNDDQLKVDVSIEEIIAEIEGS
jgi:hypothetical protein